MRIKFLNQQRNWANQAIPKQPLNKPFSPCFQGKYELHGTKPVRQGAKINGDKSPRNHELITLLMPVACRHQFFDLSDDTATNIDIQFYSDARDALLKSIAE